MQVDGNNVTVGVELRHLDPITDTHHIVRGNLDACYNTQTCVLEDQQDYGRHSAKSTQQNEGRLVEK